MNHPHEETLNDYVERALSPAEQVEVARHLESCGDCALIVTDLQHIIRQAAALGPLEPPSHVWPRIEEGVRGAAEASPEAKAASSAKARARQWAWALATAALVVLAFLTGRLIEQREQRQHENQSRQTSADVSVTPANAATSADVRERVLLIAVGDHLERSQMVLVELANANTGTRGALDISAERESADELLAPNRLYRQTALQMGQANVADLLDDLERVLVEVARGPSQVSMQQLADLQQRIEAQGILFKVKVIRNNTNNTAYR